ncbi:MAG: DNA polymerase III subunit gamma/tau [bacterium]|nr:DNA polymerase III subunit gamma/tau [bacterium]
MPNLVLYRKYRPKTFGEITGQEHVVRTLKNAVLHGMISHAYLFSGPRGCGKTTMARLLAKAVNCEKPKQGEPCNECSACKEINLGSAMDLIEIDAASNRGIDEIRDLKEGVRFSPTKLKYKVFVIDEAHQLTKEAANALLKTLEEPPSHAIFILATTEIQRMIPTLASRCQRFDFRKLRVPEMVMRLEDMAKKEGIEVEKDALELLAHHAGGSLRDAEGLLDKVLTFHLGAGSKEKIRTEVVRELLGIVDVQIIGSFADLLLAKNPGKAIEFLNKNLEDGMDPQEFAKTLIEYLRTLLILKINPALEDMFAGPLTKEQQEKMKLQSSTINEELLSRTIKNFMDAEQKMKYSSIIQLPLELAIIDSCGVV